MEWLTKQSSFKYNGKPVTRTKVTSQTIFGQFEVFEAVSGNCFYRHPFLKSSYIKHIPGWGSFDNGLEEWFGKTRRQCKSIEDGIEICEQVMNKIKENVNSY